MLSLSNWLALAALCLYLVLFFVGTLRLAGTAGRVWLFGLATGRDRLAALGFRASFVLAFLGPLLWMALPSLHESDPLWHQAPGAFLATTGAVLGWAGALLALVAQAMMGASWRVGVARGETGALVTAGLFRWSRNPTFVGQAVLLGGIALAIPSVPTALAVVLFLLSANLQIHSEEAALSETHGREWENYRMRTPRWIGLPGR